MLAELRIDLLQVSAHRPNRLKLHLHRAETLQQCLHGFEHKTGLGGRS